MNTLVAYYLDINSLDEADRSDAQALRIANVLLCNEITKSWLWPMKLPSVATATRRAQKAFERDMERGRKKAKEEALVEAGVATVHKVPMARPPNQGRILDREDPDRTP